MSKTRTKKRANSRLNMNYKPLSDSFCKSVVKDSSDKNKNNLESKIINDPNNMGTIVYNKNKTAHMQRIYDAGKLMGIRIEAKTGRYLIEPEKNLFDIIVELIHFGFTYKNIKQFVNISQSKFNTIRSKDFKSMDDFAFVISCVPDKFYRCNDIMHYVKQIPEMIVRHPNIVDLAKEMGLESEMGKCKRCVGIYTNNYPELINTAKAKVETENKEGVKNTQAENKGSVKENIKTDTVIETKNTDIEVENVNTEDKAVEITVSEKADSIEQVSETEELGVISSTLDEQGISDNIETIENSEIVENIEKVDSTINIENTDDTDNIDSCESEFECNSESESDSVNENSEKPKKRVIRKSVDIFEYQNLLGFAGLPFDFEKIGQDLFEGLKICDFSTYIENEQKDGISNLLYVLMILNNYYVYKTPFYPAEDKILELYYKDIGYKVVDVLKAVIPDYTVKSEIEYASRVREKRYKTPHPSMAFNVWDNDISLIKALYPKVKKAPTKYFYWLDSFDFFYLVEKSGLGENISKKVKTVIDLENIDLTSYILSAEKLKEVQYHNPIWTSDRHDIFKNEFKNMGLEVVKLIDGVTMEDCAEHSSQFKIFQNYTTKEIESMKDIYFEKGLEGLYEAFPYRTKDALKFKVEELGWEKLVQRGISEEEVQRRIDEAMIAYKDCVTKQVEESVEDLKKEYQEEVYNKFKSEESEKLRKDIRLELEPLISNEIKEKVFKIALGPVLQGLKVSLPDIVRKATLKDLPNVLPQKLADTLEQSLKEELSKI